MGTVTMSLADSAATAFAAYQEGQRDQMRVLVELVTPPLWAVARSAGLTAAEAEDVLQDTWVALVRNASTVREPQAVFGWLLTTTRRAAWRAARRAPGDELDSETVSPDSPPDAVVEEIDRDSRLWRHVAALSPRCQALLRVVAYATRPDYAAISAALGMPVGSIGPTRGRCLAALRTALANDPAWSTT